MRILTSMHGLPNKRVRFPSVKAARDVVPLHARDASLARVVPTPASLVRDAARLPASLARVVPTPASLVRDAARLPASLARVVPPPRVATAARPPARRVLTRASLAGSTGSARANELSNLPCLLEACATKQAGGNFGKNQNQG